MKKNIITASGKAADVVAGLKGLAAIFPKGATLSEVETAARFARMKTAIRQQTESKKWNGVI